MDTTNVTVLQLCCYVSCGILSDICMKHGETLKTKAVEQKNNNKCTNIVKSYLGHCRSRFVN